MIEWKVGVGIPSARTVRAQFVKDLNEWLSEPIEGVQMQIPDWDLTAGRIDWARSNLFLRARAVHEKVHIQVDTDVKMHTPAREVVRYLVQDQELGFDIVCGPTSAYNGQLMIARKDGVKPTGRKAFDVKRSAFGFVAFGEKILQELKPSSSIRAVDGVDYPLFSESSRGTTEDYDWCDHAIEQGFRVGLDPRIRVSHTKEVGVMTAFEDEPFAAPQACIVVTQRFEAPPELEPVAP